MKENLEVEEYLRLLETKKNAANDGHYFSSKNNSIGLWFGAVDDLWKFGQPIGYGGPWKNTNVKAGEYSLPYLMTGYDKKKVELSADRDVVLSVEVNFNHNGGIFTRHLKFLQIRLSSIIFRMDIVHIGQE